MSEEELYEKIHDYLAGNLSDTAATSLAAQIEDDPAVAELYQMARLELDMADTLLDRQLNEKMKKLEADTPVAEGRYQLMIILLFSLLLLILGLFVFFRLYQEESISPALQRSDETKSINEIPAVEPLNTDTISTNPSTSPANQTPVAITPLPPMPNKQDVKQLALAYAVEERPFSKIRIRSSDVNSSEVNLKTVLKAVDAADFEQALALIDTILADSTQRIYFWEAQQFKGFIAFQQGDYKTAIQILTPVLNEDVGRIISTKWYLALAHLANSQTEQAQKHLEALQAIPVEYDQKEAVTTLLTVLEEH